MGLKGRILSLFIGCFFVNSLTLAGFFIYSSRLNEDALYRMAQASRQIQTVGAIQREFGQLVQAWKNILIRGNSFEKIKTYGNEMDLHAERIQLHVSDLRRSDLEKIFEAHLVEFEGALSVMIKGYRGAQERYLNQQVFMPGEADLAVKGIDRQVLNGIEEIVKLVQEQSNRYEKGAIQTNRVALQISIFGSLLCAAVSLLLFFVFLSRMTQAMSRVTDRLVDSSSELAVASTRIASSSTKLSEAVSEQASTTQEIMAAVDEISVMVRRNAQSSAESNLMAEETEKISRRGQESVNEMLHAIDSIAQINKEIMQNVAQSNEEFSDVVKVIDEIGSRTRVINDIVFQTKLLSFNASVEAARAGEHGRGFAIVADEVGKLAQMSGSAANEIALMLEKSTKKVMSIAEVTESRLNKVVERGISKVEIGNKTAQECLQVLDRILVNFSQVHKMIKEVDNASSEQARGLDEVARAIAQLDMVSQKNSSAAEETSAAGGKLRSESDVLESMAVDLRKLIGSKSKAKILAPITAPDIKLDESDFKEAA